jgi:hypothetical protein
MALFLQASTVKDKGVSWSTVDPFCGRITSAESVFPVSAATVKLYRATAKHLPCCASALRLEDVKIDKAGNFDLRRLTPGQYWMVVAWGQTNVFVPIWADQKYNYACDDSSYTLIDLKPKAGTFEVLFHTSTN